MTLRCNPYSRIKHIYYRQEYTTILFRNLNILTQKTKKSDNGRMEFGRHSTVMKYILKAKYHSLTTNSENKRSVNFKFSAPISITFPVLAERT